MPTAERGVSRARFPRGTRRTGSVRTLADVYSAELGNHRDLHVYLPPSYDGGDARYPVIYLQDGQNLFDDATSFAGAWGAGIAADSAARLGYEAIIVGVSNVGPVRIDEYSPFVDPRLGGGKGERYLAFLVRTVKPLIDRDFRTQRGRRHTIVGGASMGGLLALYAFFRYPDVFGVACVQSPALWFASGAIFDYVDAAPFYPGRIYLDVGRREGEGTLRNARRMCASLIEKGYVENKTLKWVEDARGAHHESAWGRRLKKALPFLLEEST
jgi:predicted alpha/beta superfamily hydrolase